MHNVNICVILRCFLITHTSRTSYQQVCLCHVQREKFFIKMFKKEIQMANKCVAPNCDYNYESEKKKRALNCNNETIGI